MAETEPKKFMRTIKTIATVLVIGASSYIISDHYYVQQNTPQTEPIPLNCRNAEITEKPEAKFYYAKGYYKLPQFQTQTDGEGKLQVDIMGNPLQFDTYIIYNQDYDFNGDRDINKTKGIVAKMSDFPPITILNPQLVWGKPNEKTIWNGNTTLSIPQEKLKLIIYQKPISIQDNQLYIVLDFIIKKDGKDIPVKGYYSVANLNKEDRLRMFNIKHNFTMADDFVKNKDIPKYFSSRKEGCTPIGNITFNNQSTNSVYVGEK